MEMSEHTSYKTAQVQSVSTVKYIILMVEMKKKENMSMFFKS